MGGLAAKTTAQRMLLEYNAREVQQELAQKQAQYTQQYLKEESKIAKQLAGGKRPGQKMRAGAAAIPSAAVPATTVAPPVGFPRYQAAYPCGRAAVGPAVAPLSLLL